jgi:hypothetical protein
MQTTSQELGHAPRSDDLQRDEPMAARPVTRSMDALLYTLTALTFFAGTQLFVLSEHTAAFFSWTIDPPMTATFVGAGFWSAAVSVFWAARQRDWVLARVPIPTIAVVATMLLVATLQNLTAFHGPLGLAWIEVYALFAPVLAALVAMQLVTPGVDRHSGAHLPRALRFGLAGQALAAIAVGVALFASQDLASTLWPWELTELTGKAIGTWLIGIGATAGFVALVDDRAAMPGNALAQLVLAGGVLFGLARFAGDVDFASGEAFVLLAYLLSTLITGAYATRLALREGRFTPTQGARGIPVELRFTDQQRVAPARSHRRLRTAVPAIDADSSAR